jgi:hypothetical protein
MAEIIAILVPAFTVILFAWFFLRMRRPRKAKPVKDDDRTRQERAVWAWAKILSASQGPLNTFHMARVELQFEVHMPGSPAYQAKATWLVEEESLTSVLEGKEISLKVDPQAPQYVYPNGAWAKLLE